MKKITQLLLFCPLLVSPFVYATEFSNHTAMVPASSFITLIVESGNGETVTDSKEFMLKSGTQDIPLAGLKAGTDIRIRVKIETDRLGTLPQIQTVSLGSGSHQIRWSTTDEWQKGTASGSIKIGQ
jgi:hypothetical protein